MTTKQARTPVRIGLIQMRCDRSAEENLRVATERIRDAAKKGAEIVVLPELFLGPYFCQRKNDDTAKKTAEPIPGPTSKALSALAKELTIILCGGSVYEKAPDGKMYNTAIVFERDGTLLKPYRKTHIPEDILYHEQQYFTPGNTGVTVYDTSVGKIAVLICFDQWFPEAARIATLQGAELLIYPTAIGLIDSSVEENITGNWQQMWTNVMLGHAASNTVYVAAVNRVGQEGKIGFWGGSFVADPSSAILARGGGKEEIVIADCDLAHTKALQDAWGFLRNRRPETYGLLTKPLQ